MTNEKTFSPETIAFVIRALEQSARPLSKTELENRVLKSAQLSKENLSELLKQLVKTGQLRVQGSTRKFYWLPEMEAPALERILEVLQDTPLTKTELENKLRSWLHGWPKSKREEMVAQLLKDQRVYKVAPLTGKAKLLSLRSQATTQDYVRLALQLVSTKLAKQGIHFEDVLAAAQDVLRGTPSQPETVPSPTEPAVTIDLSQLLMERMFHLNPAAATGALVSLSELRRALQAEISGKTDFDQAILQLAEQGRVALHRHDYVSSLSQTERDALVSDPSGNHFVGIAVRI